MRREIVNVVQELTPHPTTTYSKQRRGETEKLPRTPLTEIAK